jgi:hypothetical protein
MSRDAEGYQLGRRGGSPGSGLHLIRLLACCGPARETRRDQTGTAVLFALTAA